MDKNELKSCIKQALVQIQEWSGNPVPEITDDTKPLLDLAGFDSQNAVEVLTLIEEILGLNYVIPEGVFISSKYKQYFSIVEIADRLYATIMAKKR